MQIGPEITYLAQEDVLATGFGMKETIKVVEDALRLQSENKVVFPSKTVLDLGEQQHGRLNAMSAYVGGNYEMCGIKWIAGFPANPKNLGIPRAHAIIILNDSKTGVPLSIMDGTLISAMRTGAVSGIGVKYLAKSNCEVLGIIGCGVQSYTQIMAVMEVRPKLKKIKLFDILRKNSNQLKKWVEKNFSVEVETTENDEIAVRNSDIVITVTVADKPIVKAHWLTKGHLFIHVGSYQEEEEDVILNSDKIIVDNWDEVKHRKTPLLARLFTKGKIKDPDIWSNLGNIIIGMKSGRERDDENIYFAPLGLAIEDISVGTSVYKKAKSMNLGKKISLWSRPAEWMIPK